MTADEIKQSLTMRDVLDRYGIKVNRNGMCCCPIHGEKHPSMKVYADGYKCFACNSAGDIFNFVMAYENVDFKTAFIMLGGTYEKQKTKTARVVRNTKFQRRKAATKRTEIAEKEFRKLLEDAIFDCMDLIANNEVFSDDWCFGQTWLQRTEYYFDEIYINEDKGVNRSNVIRNCQRIRQRTDKK